MFLHFCFFIWKFCILIFVHYCVLFIFVYYFVCIMQVCKCMCVCVCVTVSEKRFCIFAARVICYRDCITDCKLYFKFRVLLINTYLFIINYFLFVVYYFLKKKSLRSSYVAWLICENHSNCVCFNNYFNYCSVNLFYFLFYFIFVFSFILLHLRTTAISILFVCILFCFSSLSICNILFWEYKKY